MSAPKEFEVVDNGQVENKNRFLNETMAEVSRGEGQSEGPKSASGERQRTRSQATGQSEAPKSASGQSEGGILGREAALAEAKAKSLSELSDLSQGAQTEGSPKSRSSSVAKKPSLKSFWRFMKRILGKNVWGSLKVILFKLPLRTAAFIVILLTLPFVILNLAIERVTRLRRERQKATDTRLSPMEGQSQQNTTGSIALAAFRGLLHDTGLLVTYAGSLLYSIVVLTTTLTFSTVVGIVTTVVATMIEALETLLTGRIYRFNQVVPHNESTERSLAVTILMLNKRLWSFATRWALRHSRSVRYNTIPDWVKQWLQ